MWTSGLSTPLSAQALKIHHTQENNRFIAPRHAPVPRQRRDSGAWVQSGPRRTSGRQKGDPRPDQKEEEEKEDGAVARRNSGKRAYIPTPLGEWDGQPFVFPPWTDEEDTQRSDRNTSCHICTQGSKSWRGNFTKPLACGFCPKIFCSRCLFHINGSDTVDESEAFIAEKQGTGWLCFMCCGICACQGHTGRPLDWHKRAGWVGVTGGGLVMNKQKQPRMSMRSTRESAHQDQATEEETAAAEEPFVAAAALPVLASPERGSDGGAGLMVSPECIVREGTPVPSLLSRRHRRRRLLSWMRRRMRVSAMLMPSPARPRLCPRLRPRRRPRLRRSVAPRWWAAKCAPTGRLSRIGFRAR